MVGAGIFKSGKGKKLPRRNGIWLGRHERRAFKEKETWGRYKYEISSHGLAEMGEVQYEFRMGQRQKVLGQEIKYVDCKPVLKDLIQYANEIQSHSDFNMKRQH